MQKVIECKLIQDNHSLFVNKCNKTYERITNLINNKDTTWNYSLYNVFTVTAGDVYFINYLKNW